jgi:hypothetical protein
MGIEPTIRLKMKRLKTLIQKNGQISNIKNPCKALKDNKKGPLFKQPFFNLARTGEISNQLILDLLVFSELPG